MAQSIENKRRFFEWLLEAFRFSEVILRRNIAVAQEELNKRAAWIKAAEKDKGATLDAQEIVRAHVDTKQVDLHIPTPNFLQGEQNPISVMQVGLRGVSSRIIASVMSDSGIRQAHRKQHAKAVEKAFCVDNPKELLRRLHRTHQFINQLSPDATDDERNAHVSKYLATMGEEDNVGELSQQTMHPELKEQLKADFLTVNGQSLPQNPEEYTVDSFTRLFGLTTRNFYRMFADTEIRRGVEDSADFVTETAFVANRHLSANSIFNFRPQPGPQFNSQQRYDANQWMWLFRNTPFSTSLQPGFGAGRYIKDDELLNFRR